MVKFLFIILLLTSSLLSAISIELVNGRVIEGKIIKVLENDIYLEVYKTLFIINKDFISEPKRYVDVNYIENENEKIHFNSYRIVEINSLDDYAPEIISRDKIETRANNNFIYAELFGSGIFYSINFEKRIYKDFFIKLGASAWQLTFFGSTTKATIFPIALIKTFGKGSTKIELGGGISIVNTSSHNSSSFFSSDNDSNQYVIGNANISLRFEPYPTSFIIKVGFSPLIWKDGFRPWPSICTGFSF